MLRRLFITAYCWHVVLNCAFFSGLFGLPSMLLPRWVDPDRRIPHRIGTFWWGQMVWWTNPFWRIEIEGRERLDDGGPFLICSNHQSFVDVLALMALGGDFKWVSGLRFFRIPIFAQYMRLTGYIAADLKNPFSASSVLEECGHWLGRGVSIGLFPEGTRSASGELGKFKPGAFRVAVDHDLPVLPVAIDGTRAMLPKGRLTYLGSEPFLVARVRVLPPIRQSELGSDSPVELSRACRRVIGEALDDMRGRTQQSDAGGDRGSAVKAPA